MDSVKLACSSSVYIGISLVEAIHRIADIGYKAIEIRAGHERPDTGLPYEESINAIKLALSQREVEVANIVIPSALSEANELGNNGSIPAPGDDIWANQQYIEMIKHYIRLASDLNCPVVTVSPGKQSPGTAAAGIQSSLALAGLNDITKFARGFGISMGILYGPGYVIGCATGIKPLFFKCRGLKLSFHVGNSHLAYETPCQIAADFKHRIAHIYIADVGSDDRLFMVPGMGEIEWISFFRTLTWIGYRGFVTVELSSYRDNPDWAATRSFFYLTNIINGFRQPNKKLSA